MQRTWEARHQGNKCNSHFGHCAPASESTEFLSREITHYVPCRHHVTTE